MFFSSVANAVMRITFTSGSNYLLKKASILPF